MTSYTLFDNSSSSSASIHETVELRSRSKNQHSSTVDPWRQESPQSSGSRHQLLDHNVKNGETLMQISLLYSVPVSKSFLIRTDER